MPNVRTPKPNNEDRGYASLLAEYLPTVIKNVRENEQALDKLAELIDKGEENWTLAEARIFELVSTLVEKFEDEAYPMGNLATPVDSLRTLSGRAIADAGGSRGDLRRTVGRFRRP